MSTSSPELDGSIRPRQNCHPASKDRARSPCLQRTIRLLHTYAHGALNPADCFSDICPEEGSSHKKRAPLSLRRAAGPRKHLHRAAPARMLRRGKGKSKACGRRDYAGARPASLQSAAGGPHRAERHDAPPGPAIPAARRSLPLPAAPRPPHLPAATRSATPNGSRAGISAVPPPPVALGGGAGPLGSAPKLPFLPYPR